MTVADLTPEQLKAYVKESVREALEELLSDPDEGLELRDALVERLLSSSQRAGPNLSLTDLAKELGLPL
jgi:hypothetical protein